MTAPTSPALDVLLHRLLDTPPDFLDPPRQRNRGQVHVAAVVNDVLALHGVTSPMSLLAALSGRQGDVNENRLMLSALMAWLLADDCWAGFDIAPAALLELFTDTVPALAAETAAVRYVHEPERREELARTSVARLGLLPQGETVAQAADRLASVSSVERRRLLEASRAAEARARAIREALARKAAEESADKWTRE